MEGESRCLPQEQNFVLSQQLNYQILYHLHGGGSIKIQMAITQNTTMKQEKITRWVVAASRTQLQQFIVLPIKARLYINFMQQTFCFIINITIPVMTVITCAYIMWFQSYFHIVSFAQVSDQETEELGVTSKDKTFKYIL